MKTFIIIIMVILVTNVVSCQQAMPVPELTKQEYLIKSKHQKTAAFILLGSGIIEGGAGLKMAVARAVNNVTTVTIGIISGTPPPAPTHSYKTESTLMILGAASVLSSIPLFAASGKNKKKSVGLSVKTEMIQQVRKGSLTGIPVPSLRLHIRI